MTMTRSRLFGATLLVSGTTIGAAMLALPVGSGSSGFIPSLLVMIAGWLFMYFSARILLEVCLVHPEDSNLLTLAYETLGRRGAFFAVASYVFLLYALITAYLAALSGLFEQFGATVLHLEVPKLLYALPLVILFSFIFFLGVQALDRLNRILMIGLVIGFVLLISASLPVLDFSRLVEIQHGYLLASLPIVVTAFGFHVIIPSLVSYLERDERMLQKALFWGSIIPLIAYILWQMACLGSIPLTGQNSIAWGYENDINGAALLAHQTKSYLVAVGADFFSFCAILTSFLGVSLSLFDFLKDALKKYSWAQSRKVLLVVTFLPPLFFVLSNPRAFFVALDLAGTYGVVVLLALLPGIMLWIKRFRYNDMRFARMRIERSGLILYILFSCLFILIEACIQTGIIET